MVESEWKWLWNNRGRFCEKGTADQGPEREETWGHPGGGSIPGRWMSKLEDAKGEKMRSVGHMRYTLHRTCKTIERTLDFILSETESHWKVLSWHDLVYILKGSLKEGL